MLNETIALHPEVTVYAYILVDVKYVHVGGSEWVTETVGQADEAPDEAEATKTRMFALFQIVGHFKLDVCIQHPPFDHTLREFPTSSAASGGQIITQVHDSTTR